MKTDNKLLNELLGDMNLDEEIEKTLKAYNLECIKIENYACSEAFNCDFSILRAYLKTNTTLCSDSSDYSKDLKLINICKLFNRVIRAVNQMFHHLSVEDEDAMFYTKILKYNGITFTTVSGQGSYVVASLTK